MNELTRNKCFEVAYNLVKTCGAMIKSAINKKKNIETKASARDLVTETDKAIEELVIKSLSQTFPNHKFIGEESVAKGMKCQLTDMPTWILDPVDGTMNFVHSFPYTCISLALWVNKIPEIGIVYNPNLEHMFTACRGQGAFLNGEKIRVSGQKDLSQSLIFTELGTTRPDTRKMEITHNNFRKLMECTQGIHPLVELELAMKPCPVFDISQNLLGKAGCVRVQGCAALNCCNVASGFGEAYYHFGLHCWDMAAGVLIVTEAGGSCYGLFRVRSMGSAALNMCSVAQGGSDGYFEIGIHAWDMAAGSLIIEEAGGHVCDVDGEEFDILNRRIICGSSKEICDALVGILETYEEERD